MYIQAKITACTLGCQKKDHWESELKNVNERGWENHFFFKVNDIVGTRGLTTSSPETYQQMFDTVLPKIPFEPELIYSYIP